MAINPGFDKKEIEQLKVECEEAGQNYVLVLDEQELSETGEYVQFQFVGSYKGNEVIYDAAIFTLELHYAGLVLEEAEKRVAAIYKDFIPIEERDDAYIINPKADELIEEFVEEMEEDEDIKVAEFIKEDLNFEFGIGLEIAKNVSEISSDLIEEFINQFNNEKIALDNNRYSFKLDITK